MEIGGYKYAELTGLSNGFFTKNRSKYFDNLKKMLTGLEEDSIVVLQGGDEIPHYDCDIVNYHFVQEPNFYYLTGVRETKFYGVFDIKNKSVTMFYNLDKDERHNIFMKIPSLKELAKKYEMPVLDLSDLYDEIHKRNPAKIYLLSGTNSDSGLNVKTAELNFPEKMKEFEKRLDYNPYIYEILAETRTVKTDEEISLMQYINDISIEAHLEAMKSVKPENYERDVENAFFNYLKNNYYTRHSSYDMICGCGINSATLHYVNNDKKLKDGDLILMDMGISFCGYASDITMTVPINGKFTEQQAAIYNIVLNANRTVQKNLKPGVYWPEMHLLAERVILEGLVKLGLLSSDYNVDEMLKDRVAYYFMPHGLGHLLGVNVHDVGGYLSFTPKRINEPGLSSLRTARYIAENTVITVEPGIYFIPFLLDKALNDERIKKYFISDKIKSFYSFGGVRIEDDVVVTVNGCVNLTAKIPREVKDIEMCMKAD
jgi:Xaa-Pro dipeptidase